MNPLVLIFAVIVALKGSAHCPPPVDRGDIREEIQMLEEMGDPPPRRYKIKDIKEEKDHVGFIDLD